MACAAPFKTARPPRYHFAMHDLLPTCTLDAERFRQTLLASEAFLIIQDLDGVCMGLVRDPLTRTLERRYVEAAHVLDGRFYVLTNGEHIGRRGVNAIVDATLDDPDQAGLEGLYLPGLAAGGVQSQDRYGQVTHPGVSDAEHRFLAAFPERALRFLTDLLTQPPFRLQEPEALALAEVCVLDNAASPTLNLNPLHHRFTDDADTYRQAQVAVQQFMQALLERAEQSGLGDSFFVHYAPNMGRDAKGGERIQWADDHHAGTTDFQFMLRGAVKEAGVLVLLNHYYFSRTGQYPLGEDFNAREAPADHPSLIELAVQRFDPALMPRIVGVGDTLTSTPDDSGQWQRGGSDRGFLTLVQDLGQRFETGNIVIFVDSSGGEVRRPGVQTDTLDPDADVVPIEAMSGLCDPEDPLRPNLIMPGGHVQYVNWFCALAAATNTR